jgi:selenocysteine lyase/cysteine desulfurase
MTPLNRRTFIDKLGILSATTLFSALAAPAWSKNLQGAIERRRTVNPANLAADEDFWYYVQQAYTNSSSLVNLNNGGVAPSPKVVQDAMKRYYDMCNEAPSYYMWRILDQGREPVRKSLSQLAGCAAEEIALQRNASEALETVIFGLSLQKGDEVVLSKQDYPNMINAWKQREQRDGIKLVWVNLELPSDDKEYLTNTYVNAFTAKTKLVHVTHVINWNGQILPVKQIADAAHARGIEVLVDGAHSFAHFDFTLPGLGADYFGSSLHKWLSACIGTGMLYVRKEKIKNLYPLFAAPDPKSADIRKFENLGTRPFFIEQAIGKAIEFHEMIGSKRKEERLLYLKNYWMTQVSDISNIRLGTSMKAGSGCAIGLVSVNGKKPAELERFLMDSYKIHTVAIEWENISGVRITPNVYTTTKNLNMLAEGLRQFARS